MGRRGTGFAGLYRFPWTSEWPLGAIAPSPQWDGTAGSGYSNPPIDPDRATAKPALRLLVPPRQFLTDELVIGVAAMANNGGSMRDNMGLDMVRVYFEGDQPAEIRTPSFRTIIDARGNPATYYGWWITLVRPSGLTGIGNVYFEAVPADASMQSRVIGPFQFGMAEEQYDADVTVALSDPSADYTGANCLAAACAALKARNPTVHHPRIQVIESGIYDFGDHGINWVSSAGYLTVEPAGGVDVTIAKSGYTTDAASILLCARWWSGIWFRNLTFDFRYISEVYQQTTLAYSDHVFEGCAFLNSGGRENVLRGGPFVGAGKKFRANPYMLECTVSELMDSFFTVRLARGCTLTDLYGDVFTGADCVVGCTVTGVDNSFWLDDTPALALAYNGAGSATVERSGLSADMSATTYTFKVDGVSVGTFACGRDYADFTAAKTASGSPPAAVGYYFADLAAFLNATGDYSGTGIGGDWVATDLGTGKRASSGSLEGRKGLGFSATPVGGASDELTVVSNFDLHSDIWQLPPNTQQENVIFSDNTITDAKSQNLLLSGSNSVLRDAYFINNAFHNSQDVNDYWSPEVVASQIGRGNHSGLVLAHNSMPLQDLVPTTAGGENYGAGQLFILNNVVQELRWSGTADPDVVVNANHSIQGSAPAYAANHTTGGDAGSLFVNAGAGDFTPAGELLSARHLPVISLDRGLNMRALQAPPGAFGSK